MFNAWAIFVLVAPTAVLWFLARPGGSLRPKLAAVSAAVAAGLALLAKLLSTAVRLVLVLGLAAVAIDRIFVDVHYPVDSASSLVSASGPPLSSRGGGEASSSGWSGC